jgi:hypothetical protein
VADWPFGFHFDVWLQDNLSMSDPGLAGELYTNLNGLTRPPPFFASYNRFVGARAFILDSHHVSWKVGP